MVHESVHTFPSIVSHLKDVEEIINALFKEYSIAEDLYGNVLLCTMEACNNAIVHGNNSNPELIFKVSFRIINNELEVTVEDSGPGYDFNNLPNPTDPENIDKPTGRGIFLVRSLADELNFENDGTLLKMKFFLNLEQLSSAN